MLSPDVGCCEQSSSDEGHAVTSGDADFNCLEGINRSGISASICNIVRKFNTVSTMGAHFIFPLGFHGGIAWVEVHGVPGSPGASWLGEW